MAVQLQYLMVMKSKEHVPFILALLLYNQWS